MRKHFFPVAMFVALVSAAPAAHADLLVDLLADGTLAICSACGTAGTMLGYSFTVNSPITVDGLGVWDFGSAPLGSDTEAGLFDSSGDLLASVEITDSSTPVPSADTSGQWLFGSIAPITLEPGNYELGALDFNSGPVLELDPPLSIQPQITVLEGEIGTIGGGFQAPLTAFPELVFGPTLETVPEPGLLGLLLGAAAALVLGRSFRARRSKPIFQ
jgi:hypothetical protein